MGGGEVKKHPTLQEENDHLKEQQRLTQNRLLKLERYSSKVCLIFNGIFTKDDTVIAVTQILNHFLAQILAQQI